MASQLEILIRALWQGAGSTRQAQADIAGIGTSSRTTSLAMAAAEQRAGMLQQEMARLAREVAQGNRSLDSAADEYNRLARELRDIDNAASEAQRGLQETSEAAGGAGGGFERLTRGIFFAREAFETVMQAGRQVHQMLTEAAELEVAEQRFNNLAASIGVTGDALRDDLGVAVRGMLSNAEAMALAGDLMSLGLAKTHDQVVRLTRVSSALNMDMNQLVLTLANQTTMRFDQLGVAVDGFAERLANLKAQGLDTNEAFTEAFLQQAEAQILRVGDTAETAMGDLKRMEADWNELSDGFKMWLLSTTDEFLATASGRRGEQLRAQGEDAAATAESVTDLAIAFKELNAEAEKLRKQDPIAFGIFTADAFEQGAGAIAQQLALVTDSAEEFDREARRIFGARNLGNIIAEFGVTTVAAFRALALGANQAEMELGDFAQMARDLRLPTDEIIKFARALDEAADADRKFFNDMDDADEVHQRRIDRLIQLAHAHEKAGAASAEALERGRGMLEERLGIVEVDVEITDDSVDEAEEKLSQAIDGIINRAIGQQGSIIDRLFEAKAGLEASGGQWVQGVVDRGAELAEINAQINADLTKEEREAWQERVEAAEEGSAEYIQAVTTLNNDITDSKRQQLIVDRALLEDEHGQLTQYYTGNLEEQRKYQEQVDELNQQLRDSFAQTVFDIVTETGGFDRAAANVAVSLGLMSQAEADFRLRTFETTESLRELGIALDEGLDPTLGTTIFEGIIEQGGVATDTLQNIISETQGLGVAVAEGAITEEQGKALVAGLVAGKDDWNAALDEMRGALRDWAEDVTDLGDIDPASGFAKAMAPELEKARQDILAVAEGEFTPQVNTSEIEGMNEALTTAQLHIDAINASTIDPTVNQLQVETLLSNTDGSLENLGSISDGEWGAFIDGNWVEVNEELNTTLGLVQAIAGTHNVTFNVRQTGGGMPSAPSPPPPGRPFAPSPPSFSFNGGSAGPQSVTWTGNLIIPGAGDPNAVADRVMNRLVDAGIVPRIRVR